MTVSPALANSTASGSPTYPNPMTAARASRAFSRSMSDRVSADMSTLSRRPCAEALPRRATRACWTVGHGKTPEYSRSARAPPDCSAAHLRPHRAVSSSCDDALPGARFAEHRRPRARARDAAASAGPMRRRIVSRPAVFHPASIVSGHSVSRRNVCTARPASRPPSATRPNRSAARAPTPPAGASPHGRAAAARARPAGDTPVAASLAVVRGCMGRATGHARRSSASTSLREPIGRRRSSPHDGSSPRRSRDAAPERPGVVGRAAGSREAVEHGVEHDVADDVHAVDVGLRPQLLARRAASDRAAASTADRSRSGSAPRASTVVAARARLRHGPAAAGARWLRSAPASVELVSPNTTTQSGRTASSTLPTVSAMRAICVLPRPRLDVEAVVGPQAELADESPDIAGRRAVRYRRALRHGRGAASARETTDALMNCGRVPEDGADLHSPVTPSCAAASVRRSTGRPDATR